MIIASYDLDYGPRKVWSYEARLALPFLIVGIYPLVRLPLVWGLPYFAVCAGVFAFLSYRLLFRAVYRLELTPSELRWRAAARSGAVALTRVKSIRCEPLPRKSASSPTRWSALIEVSDRKKPLRIAARPHLAEFSDKVKAAVPHLTVTLPPE